MKKLIVGTLALMLAAAGIQTARANDTTWATIGRVAVGVGIAGAIVATAADSHASCNVVYASPCPPPAVVYAPAPPPVICAPPVVYAPAPRVVVTAPRVIVRPPHVVVRHPVVVVHRGHGCW